MRLLLCHVCGTDSLICEKWTNNEPPCRSVGRNVWVELLQKYYLCHFHWSQWWNINLLNKMHRTETQPFPCLSVRYVHPHCVFLYCFRSLWLPASPEFLRLASGECGFSLLFSPFIFVIMDVIHSIYSVIVFLYDVKYGTLSVVESNNKTYNQML